MIDAKDNGTQPLDLGEAPKRRGRPSTGQALSNADRQRAYRERQKAQRNGNAEDGMAEMAKAYAEEIKALRKALEKAQDEVANLKSIIKEVDSAAMTQINGLRRELADEKAKKLKRAAPQKKRYVLQYQLDDGKWIDDKTGDYGSKQRANQACKAMNDMLKEKKERWTQG